MAEHIQTTRMRRLPTVFGVFTTFSDEILDVKRFAQVHGLKSLTLEGKCLRWRAKPAHLEGHLPPPLSIMKKIPVLSGYRVHQECTRAILCVKSGEDMALTQPC